MSDKPFGIDVSRWQGKIDWDEISNHTEPVRFVAIRATISWGYTDPWFQQNWIEAKRIKLYRTAYHVLYPGQPAVSQMDHFLQVVGDDMEELPLVIDMELDHNLAPDQIESTFLQCANIILNKTGRKPIIYSRASWIDQYITNGGSPPSWLNDYDWWLAHYLNSAVEHPGPPMLPDGVIRERCVIHQTTSRGSPIGVESQSLDYNRWQYDLQHLNDYVNVQPELTLEEKVELLWAAHPELH